MQARASDLLSNVRQFFRPLLRPMQYAKDTDGFVGDSIGSYIGSALNDELAGPLNAPRTAHRRHGKQALNGGIDTVIYQFSGLQTICFDVIENSNSIGEGERRPFETHDLAFSLLPCCRSLPCEKRAYFLMRNSRAGIVECFLNLGAKPGIVLGGVLCQREWQRPFIGGARQ